MGQKINPIGLRLGINRTWDSRWFADGAEYGKLLHEDIKVRRTLKKRLYQAGVSKIIIERPHKKCRITIYAARPGVIIGKKGADIDKLRKDLSAMTEGEVFLNIVEVRKPETDAQLISESITQQLERRIAFRRAMKRAIQSAMRMGANDFLTQPIKRTDFREAMARFERAPKRVMTTESKLGKVYTFLGTKGGIGTTTLAVNVIVIVVVSVNVNVNERHRRRC